MRAILFVVLGCALVAGCAKTERADSAAEPSSATKPVDHVAAPATASTPTTGAVLEFGEITITEGGKPIAKLHADGTTERAPAGQTWRRGPTLTADGKIVGDGGKEAAKLDATGRLTFVSGSGADALTVTSDQLTVQGRDGAKAGFELAADGSVKLVGGASKAAKDLDVVGATTPGQRKAALVLLAMDLFALQAAAEPNLKN